MTINEQSRVTTTGRENGSNEKTGALSSTHALVDRLNAGEPYAVAFGGQGGSFNLWERDLGSAKEQQLTKFMDDSVVFPCISRDGSTIVFRHLFDLYVYRPGSGGEPRRIHIDHAGDRPEGLGGSRRGAGRQRGHRPDPGTGSWFCSGPPRWKAAGASR